MTLTHSRLLKSVFCFVFPKSLSVAVMPAKKTATKRKSDVIVKDGKDPKKTKGKSLAFFSKRVVKASRLYLTNALLTVVLYVASRTEIITMGLDLNIH